MDNGRNSVHIMSGHGICPQLSSTVTLTEADARTARKGPANHGVPTELSEEGCYCAVVCACAIKHRSKVTECT
uniref:Uncharacterized protein n=1 Tax=Anguilla anguilla TaxID=7936 RepID=A0A0E9W4W3_ANGAN